MKTNRVDKSQLIITIIFAVAWVMTGIVFYLAECDIITIPNIFADKTVAAEIVETDAKRRPITTVVDEPTYHPVDQPVDQPIDQPIDQPEEQHMEQPEDQPVNNAPVEITEETAPQFNLERELTIKYSSVFHWQSSAGDFGIEQLMYLYEQCEKYDVPLDIMLGIISVESSYRSRAINGSAAGYCQIVKGTAQHVYEKFLKRGTYDIDNHQTIMTTDWRLNLELGTRLMARQYEKYGEWEKSVRGYHGSKSAESNMSYMNVVNSRMTELFNTTISDYE